MEVKKKLGIGLRSITIIYILFALIYGTVFSSINLANTINLQSLSAATAARRLQLLIGIPYIIIGTVLLALIIIFHMSYCPKNKITTTRGYGIVVTIVGVLLSLAFIAIAVFKSEISLILCIVSAHCVFIYEIILIITRKKIAKNYIQK